MYLLITIVFLNIACFIIGAKWHIMPFWSYVFLEFYDNSHCMTVRIGHMPNITLIRIILSLYWDIAHTGFQKVTTCFVLYWYLCLNGNLHIKRTIQQIIKQCLTEAPWNEFWKLILKNGTCTHQYLYIDKWGSIYLAHFLCQNKFRTWHICRGNMTPEDSCRLPITYTYWCQIK